MLFMTQYSNPFPFRVTGGSLAITIPCEIVRDMGLVPGDTALFKREPDGLRLRIIRHSKLVELANETENQLAQNVPVAQEDSVAAESPYLLKQ
jgi:antitoxin component of MazEF toxin-antitoxin module